MLRGSCSIYPVPTELRGALLPASRQPKASLMLADRVPLEDYAVAHDGFAEKPLLAKPDAVNYLATVPSDFMSEATEIDVIVPILRRTIHDILHQAKMYDTGTVDEDLIKNIMSTSPRRYLWSVK